MPLLSTFRSSRLAHGGLANLFAFGSQIFIQLVSVPVLAHAFGLVGYGVWLIISTVPTYLVLSDVGLVTAATNDMTIKHAAGDRAGVLSVLQSISVVVLTLFLVVTISVTGLVWVTQQSPTFWPSALKPHLWAIPLLTGYAAMCIFSLVPVAVMRATGHYARGTFFYDISTLAEALLIMAVATITHDIVKTAAAPLIFRSIAVPFIYANARRLQPDLKLGLSHVSMGEIRRLLPAALGVVAIPVGLGLSLQGTSLVVGAILGPVAVAMFVPVRTASRMAVQMAGMIGRALIPEVAAARGRGDMAAESRFWRINRIAKWLILIPATVVFVVFGVPAISLWTGGKIVPDQSFVAIMALTILFHGSWFLNAILLTASHDHVSVAKYIVGACTGGVAVATLLCHHWGLNGAAASLVIVDVVLSLLVGIQVRRVMADHRAALTVPDLSEFHGVSSSTDATN
jgi:O-antigen/teichoic acid export membrane protein